MQTVQPLRTKAEIERVKAALKAGNPRDWAMFVLGINTGLRISDILSIRVGNVVDPLFRRLHIKERVLIVEKKTGKTRDVLLNDSARHALKKYLTASDLQYKEHSPLFPSRIGGGRLSIQRVRAWTLINNAARQSGIEEKVGTHTMRKTYGYQLYQAGVDVTRIQNMLNHSSPSVTLRYIGITRDETDAAVRALNL